MQVPKSPKVPTRTEVFLGRYEGVKEAREDGRPMTVLYAALDASGAALDRLVWVQVACITGDWCRNPKLMSKLVLDHNLGTKRIHDHVHHGMFKGACCWFLCDRVWVDSLRQFPLY